MITLLWSCNVHNSNTVPASCTSSWLRFQLSSSSSKRNHEIHYCHLGSVRCTTSYIWQCTKSSESTDVHIPPLVMSGNGIKSYPSQQQREDAHQTLSNTVRNILNSTNCWSKTMNSSSLLVVLSISLVSERHKWSYIECVDSQQLPRSMCHGAFHSTDHMYTKECERVIGCQIGHL